MFAIDENKSIRWSVEAITPDDEFETLEGLQRIAEREEWTKQAVTDIWNGFAGTAGPFRDLKPQKLFKNRPYGLAQIWKAIQRLVPKEEINILKQHGKSLSRRHAKIASGLVTTCSDAASEPAAPVTTCQECGGTGEWYGEHCENCSGEGYVETDTVEEMPKKKAKAKKAPKAKPAPVEAKSGSNLDQLIKMIGRKQGASIEEVMARTGWTATHTVRGRISILKSKGVAIESFKHEIRGRVYRTA